MPRFSKIKGLSEVRRLQRLGKIRLGEKKKSQGDKEYPSKLDYFKCPQEVIDIYGPKPRELDIMFPVEDEAMIFPQAYKLYKTSGLWCTGDGCEYSRRQEDGDGYDEGECIPKSDDPRGDQCPFAVDKRSCKAMANLMFMLPRVPKGLGGIYQIDTSSINTILNINTAIAQYKAMFGRVSLMPFKLVIIPEVRSIKAKDGGMQKVTIFVMQLHTVATREEAEMITQKITAGALPRYEVEPPGEKDFEDMLIPAGTRRALEHKLGVESDEEESNQEVETPEGEVVDEETGEVTDEGDLMSQIDTLFDALEWPVGKRTLYKKRYEGEEMELLKILRGQSEASERS